MTYVEVLRARRLVFWIAAIVALQVVLAVWSLLSSHGHVDRPSAIPMTWLLAIGGIGPLIAASFLGGNISAEGTTLAILWTRPATRTAIAWRYFAVDAVAMLLAYLIVLAGEVLIAAFVGVANRLWFDSGSAGTIAIVLSGSFMLYAYIRLGSARLTGRGGVLAGAIWAAMFLVPGLAHLPLPAPFHLPLVGLEYVSPLTWIGSLGGSEHHNADASVVGLSVGWRALVAAVIAIVALVASVQLWVTREA